MGSQRPISVPLTAACTPTRTLSLQQIFNDRANTHGPNQIATTLCNKSSSTAQTRSAPIKLQQLFATNLQRPRKHARPQSNCNNSLQQIFNDRANTLGPNQIATTLCNKSSTTAQTRSAPIKLQQLFATNLQRPRK